MAVTLLPSRGNKKIRYKTTKTLSTARFWPAATSVGNYALFGGGQGTSTVDAFDTGLTRKSASSLTAHHALGSATRIGRYAIFAGGVHTATSGATGVSTSASAYDSSLSRTALETLSAARKQISATSVGNYALFAGGCTSSGATPSTDNTGPSAVVDAYHSSLTRVTAPSLSYSRYLADLGGVNTPSATTLDGRALVAIGSNNLHVYDSGLTQTTALGLSNDRMHVKSSTVGEHAIFAGGSLSTVDAYDTSLTRSTLTPLDSSMYYSASANIGNYALFGGGSISGFYSSPNPIGTVYVYDRSLTRTKTTDLNVAAYGLAATTVGNYILFGGGYDGNDTRLNTVTVYHHN